MEIPKDVFELIQAEQLRQGGKFISNTPDYLEKIANQAELLIQRSESAILGFVYFYCNDPEKKFSYITLIVTALSSRGSGVASALVEEILNISKARGFKACRLEVRKDNAPAIKLYERKGFRGYIDRGDKILMNVDLD